MRNKEAFIIFLLCLIFASAAGTTATETTETKRTHHGHPKHGKTPTKNTEIESPRDPVREKRYDDPSQPAVVRKTPRHPDAGKLEVDFD